MLSYLYAKYRRWLRRGSRKPRGGEKQQDWTEEASTGASPEAPGRRNGKIVALLTVLGAFAGAAILPYERAVLGAQLETGWNATVRLRWSRRRQ